MKIHATPYWLATAAALFCLAPAASAEVVFAWVTVGVPGNACDNQSQGCFGSVADVYRISEAEVTNAQYAEFLNAVAKTDANALYNAGMGSGLGGITQSGSSGSYTYSAIGGREDMPVSYVSFWDAARFANWLHNGQPTGAQDNSTTEDGAYTLTPTDVTNNTVTRNGGADAYVTSEDEWYKGAYYDANGTVYFDYPAGSDSTTSCAAAGAAANTANCGGVVGDLTAKGSYTGAASPAGTFDQGGNVAEWNDTAVTGTTRGLRGGDLNLSSGNLAASFRISLPPTLENPGVGFRVTSPVSSPSIVSAISPLGLVALGAVLGVMGLRRLRS